MIIIMKINKFRKNKINNKIKDIVNKRNKIQTILWILIKNSMKELEVE